VTKSIVVELLSQSSRFLSNISKLATSTKLHKHIPISPLLRQYNLTILFGDLMAMSVTVSTHSHTQFVRLSYHLSRPWRRPIFRAPHFIISSQVHGAEINSASVYEEIIHRIWKPTCSHSLTTAPYSDVHESIGPEDESNTILLKVENSYHSIQKDWRLHINLEQSLSQYIINIHFNIILSAIPACSRLSVSFKFADQNI
jgi:hypothetical protein